MKRRGVAATIAHEPCRECGDRFCDGAKPHDGINAGVPLPDVSGAPVTTGRRKTTEEIEKDRDFLAENNRSLRMRLAVAEQALRPFAAIEVPDGASDGAWVATTIYCNNQVTAAQIRAARAVLDRRGRSVQPTDQAYAGAVSANPVRDLPQVVTPTPTPAAQCEACDKITHAGRLCTECWNRLPQKVKDAVYDADDGPNGPDWLRALDIAVKVAKGWDWS